MVPKQLIIVFLFAAANNIVGLLHYTSLEDASAATVASSSASHQPDAKIKMTVPDIIRSFGYPSEEHWVTTSDGYIIALHRIPAGHPDGQHPEGGGVPVLLGHCLVGSSALFSWGPPDSSLAYVLADRGFDVWMINIRGNTYSRNHTHLDPCSTCKDFWSFGVEEGALLDYPAAIDYIVTTTGYDDMHFVGYSMGTTQYLMLLSEMPEYNRRFRSGFLMGSMAFVGNSTNSLVPIAPYVESLSYVYELMGIHEVLPNFEEFRRYLAHTTCHQSDRYSAACKSMYTLMLGVPSARVNLTMVPTYFGHSPSGGSLTQIRHFTQMFYNGGKFRKLDLGPKANQAKYGSVSPPDYRLDRVTAPTLLFSGAADSLSTKDDNDKIADLLGDAVVHNEVISDPEWTHLAFVWYTDAGKLLYPRMADMMAEMDEQRRERKQRR